MLDSDPHSDPMMSSKIQRSEPIRYFAADALPPSGGAAFGSEAQARRGTAAPASAFSVPRIQTPKQSVAAHQRAFTLIEVLVVIGIIVLIAGLLIPAVLHAYRTGIRTRTEADLHLIETALDAYKSDFGDYPRFDDDNTAKSLNAQQDRGARLLCRALLAPGPSIANPVTATDFVGTDAGGTGQGPDGADGPGFRIRAGAKVHQPYIQSDKFKLGNPHAPGADIATTGVNWDSKYFTDAMLLDSNGNPILYYPGLPGNTVITGTSGAFVSTAIAGAPVGPGNAAPRALYNGFDNEGYGPTPTTAQIYLSDKQLQYIMGDRTNAGYIDTTTTPPNSAVYTGPYLLWTAGPDGIFGFGIDPATGVARIAPFTGLKIDDVTNFDLPPDLRK